ncbi:MAG: radical SAM protein [bacterium]|nr:radical SAM protein [bacterium]
MTKIHILRERIPVANKLLEACSLCPRLCGVNRTTGETGFCRSGLRPKVASAYVHYWEEPPVSGERGSGTIFFSNCTQRCIFCQNYPISQLGVGREIEIEELAYMMLSLQAKKVHNINLVTPTHFIPQILKALELAFQEGLNLPILYNCGGYERVATMQLLEGIVDIYLPDAKYGDDAAALSYSGSACYTAINMAAIKEMYRQVGNLSLDEDGTAERGLIVRHLVLPGMVSGTEQVLKRLSDEISSGLYLSLMSQYFPAHSAKANPPLDRKLKPSEYERAVQACHRAGLDNGWIQEL